MNSGFWHQQVDSDRVDEQSEELKLSFLLLDRGGASFSLRLALYLAPAV